MQANLVNSFKSLVSSAEKEDIANLKEVIKASVDNPPTAAEIEAAKDNFKTLISDGITPADLKEIKTGIKAGLEAAGVTPAELEEIKAAAQEAFGDNPLFEKFSEQKESLANLKEVIKASVDNPPTAAEIEAAKDNFKTLISDGITPADLKEIKTGIKAGLEAAGVTPAELEEIKAAAQEAFGDNPLFGISDTLVGTDGKDFLLDMNAKDIPFMPPTDLKYDLGSASKLDKVFDRLEVNDSLMVADIISQVEVNNFETGLQFI